MVESKDEPKPSGRDMGAESKFEAEVAQRSNCADLLYLADRGVYNKAMEKGKEEKFKKG